MKIWVAKDWRGCHIYLEKPRLLEHLPAFPPTWSGNELKGFHADGSYADEILKCGECIERELWWSIVSRIK